MTLHSLWLFTEIAKDLNLTASAKRLFISQQALSATIKRTEEHYGVVLFERSPKFALTKEGEELLSAAKKILEIENDLMEEFGMAKDENNTGVLKIATSMARSRAYMPQLISEFNFRYPAVSIHLADEHNLRNKEALSTGEVDIIIGGYSHEMPSRIKKEILIPEVEGYILISDQLLRKYLKNDANRFLEEKASGASVSDFPNSIPISLIGNSSQGNWLMDKVPKICDHPCLFVAPEKDSLLMKHCLEGKSMIFLSKLYLDILSEKYSDIDFDSIHIFVHMINKERMLVREQLIYDSSVKHPKYFFDFIEIAKKVTAKLCEKQ